MTTYVYVAAQDDNKVSVFTMDAETGKLTPKAEVPISDGPHLLAIGPDRKVIYVGQRGLPGAGDGGGERGVRPRPQAPRVRSGPLQLLCGSGGG